MTVHKPKERQGIAANGYWKLALWLCVLIPVLAPALLPACAMSAVIASEGYFLSQFPQVGLTSAYQQYNDPWDYFGMVISTSRPGYYNDGYGVASYATGEPNSSPNPMWFKRVHSEDEFNNVFYTGSYLSQLQQDYLPRPDVMDEAMQWLKQSSNHATIALVHARAATGITYGNHPFWFEHNGRTYTLMHNGFANSARAFMINAINARHPEGDWFAAHPSNYFADPNPWHWVDSEVLFRFIMSHVIAQGDTKNGIISALLELESYFNTPGYGVYNFILSDGVHLYAFRSTPTSGTYAGYQLSYKIAGGYIGIRTQTPGNGDVQLLAKELVIFSRDRLPQHIRIQREFQTLEQNTADHQIEPKIMISPNPVGINGTLGISLIGDLPKSSPLKWEIYNCKGQLLSRRESEALNAKETYRMQLDAMPSGVYFCRVRSADFIATQRFTIAK